MFKKIKITDYKSDITKELDYMFESGELEEEELVESEPSSKIDDYIKLEESARKKEEDALLKEAEIKIGKGVILPLKEWDIEDSLEEIQKSSGQVCNPSENINCPDDMVCDLTDDPPTCIRSEFANKIRIFKNLEEIEFNGTKIIGNEEDINLLKDNLITREEGTEILEPEPVSIKFEEAEGIKEEIKSYDDIKKIIIDELHKLGSTYTELVDLGMSMKQLRLKIEKDLIDTEKITKEDLEGRDRDIKQIIKDELDRMEKEEEMEEKEVKDEEEEVEEEEVTSFVPSEDIGPVDIKDKLEEIQDLKDTEINKIKLAQSQILKCLGLTS